MTPASGKLRRSPDTAWPYLVGRTKNHGYRVVVAPDFLQDERSLGALRSSGKGPRTSEDTALIETLDTAKGRFGVVCRNYFARMRDFGLDGDEIIADDKERPVELIEGLVLAHDVETIRRLGLTSGDLAHAHDVVAPHFRRFWQEQGVYRLAMAAPISIGASGAPLRFWMPGDSVTPPPRPQPGPDPMRPDRPREHLPASQADPQRKRALRWRLAVVGGATAAIVIAVAAFAAASGGGSGADTSSPPGPSPPVHTHKTTPPKLVYTPHRRGTLNLKVSGIGHNLGSMGKSWGASKLPGPSENIRYTHDAAGQGVLVIAGETAILHGPARGWTLDSCINATYRPLTDGLGTVLTGRSIAPGHGLCVRKLDRSGSVNRSYLVLLRVESLYRRSITVHLKVWKVTS